MALFSFDDSTSNGPAGERADLRRRRWVVMSSACCLAGALPLRLANAQSAEVQKHLAAAQEAAGSDLLPYLGLGDSARADIKRPPFSLAAMMALPPPPPGRAFDNLYFVGSKWVSAWAIPTSVGIVLIDAMDNDDEAERIVDRGMRQLGLDPAQIKSVLITHGHGDHYGGWNYLKRKYNPRLYMSEADWTMTETRLEFDNAAWGRPPKRDASVADGDVVRLGDTSIDVLVTPGHTMGTMSLIFPVRDGTQNHRALLWGGTAFNFGKQPARLRAYIDSVERTKKIAAAQGVDVFVSNHALYDQAIDKLATMEAGKPNPFVVGTQTVQRALTVMSECARAVLASWET